MVAGHNQATQGKAAATRENAAWIGGSRKSHTSRAPDSAYAGTRNNRNRKTPLNMAAKLRKNQRKPTTNPAKMPTPVPLPRWRCLSMATI